MTSPTLNRKTEVVIIGGGGGAILARALSDAHKRFDPSKHNLTLINQLPYGIFLPSTIRMVVTAEQNLDSLALGGLMPFDKLFAPGNAGRFLQAKVARVLEGNVELVDGTLVSYDYLVIATGSNWTGPSYFDYTSDADVRSHIASWRKKIASANRIVIVGGGSVGVGAFLSSSF